MVYIEAKFFPAEPLRHLLGSLGLREHIMMTTSGRVLHFWVAVFLSLELLFATILLRAMYNTRQSTHTISFIYLPSNRTEGTILILQMRTRELREFTWFSQSSKISKKVELGCASSTF